MNGTTFDTFSAARALESVGIERDQAEAIARAINAQTLTRADLEPLATETELFALKSEVAVGSWYQRSRHRRDLRDRRREASLRNPPSAL